ncbi:beta-lactamase domain protein [Desulfatibacillum aliphaticivorans]|uniref:Beta-lactamase domain protein n=1 Tax=Desulfatibacillum aliphaticivorans TaxID=218208 RepID=B8FD50_DESAL|nr:MBL fold metallo-hydrolase [Desulfatibacillum aliphaticivorans]ACL06481.1 beta-lactamase domain protein [Desulfatibacillum aliphaticivorans]
MPKITIHRGARTIGGSCIEIQSGNRRILFDLGMPLMETDGAEINPGKAASPSIENVILPDVPGLYSNQEPGVDAIFISHAHPDHYGLLNYVHPSIPVYMSPGTNALIDIGNVFYAQKTNIQNRRVFQQWEPISLGPFVITPHLMDHSGPDASGFLIEVEDKRIFYSGDFRGHGRKGKLLGLMEKQGLSELDCLLMEGTTLGGMHDAGFPTEADVEKAMQEIFSNQKDVTFVMASGSNLDRIVSIYKAARRSEKTLVIDLYTCHLLNELKKIWPSLPPHGGDNLRVLYAKGHADRLVESCGREMLYKYSGRQIKEDEILKNREQMILRIPLNRMDRIARIMAEEKPLAQASFIFSMWTGYLQKDRSFADFYKVHNMKPELIHTSGHAYLEDLKRLVDIFKPKTLIPVHTLHGDSFGDHFDNVLRLEDGQPYKLS